MSGLLARDLFSRERPLPPPPHPGGRGASDLLFQPRYRLADRRLTALEATTQRNRSRLFRGQPPSPRDGREILRDRILFHDACRYAARWSPASPQSASGCAPLLSLRVSEVQAASGMLAPLLSEVLAESGLRAGRLELEFSEESLERDEQDLLYLLGSLRDLDVGIVLGGFGSSVSSLTLLRRRSIAGLLCGVRIAASTTRDLAGSDQRDQDFLRSLCDCAHALGLTLLAEGVDSEQLLERLLEAGGNEGIGDWLGEPMTATATLTGLRPLPEPS